VGTRQEKPNICCVSWQATVRAQFSEHLKMWMFFNV